jgi:hypothetical protein
MRTVATLLTILLLTLCAVALVGCKAAPVVHGGGALAYIDAAKPHSDNEGKGLLDKASGEVRKDESTTVATAGLLEAERRETTRLRQELKDERNHWVGWLTRHWGSIVIGAIIGAWVGLGVLGVVSGALGYWKLSIFILRALPLANPFAVIRKRMTGVDVSDAVTTRAATMGQVVGM